LSIRSWSGSSEKVKRSINKLRQKAWKGGLERNNALSDAREGLDGAWFCLGESKEKEKEWEAKEGEAGERERGTKKKDLTTFPNGGRKGAR